MFIAVNITSIEIEFALIDEKANIVSRFSISTQNKKTDDQYTTEIKNVFDYLQVDKNKITHSAILSSIPKFNHIVCNFFKKYIKIEPIIISNEDVRFNCAEDIDKTKLPVDVFIGCYACNKKYGSNVIYINVDTIITFSVCINNEFVGYCVFPGMDMLANAIHQQASEYPEIIIEPTNKIFSGDVYNSMNIGIFNGVMGACDNIVNNILTSYNNKQFTVVATCKKPEMLRYSKTINIIDPDLRINSIIEGSKDKMFSI